uniref:Secreted protein n=1 Tax=Parastrongyloides trichosuri TaxID=131310 RepID=A0A0N4ZDL2_PARTI
MMKNLLFTITICLFVIVYGIAGYSLQDPIHLNKDNLDNDSVEARNALVMNDLNQGKEPIHLNKDNLDRTDKGAIDAEVMNELAHGMEPIHLNKDNLDDRSEEARNAIVMN